MRRVRLTLALLQAAHCFAPRSSLHKPHSPATKGCTRRRRRLSATNEELLDAIQALSKRIDSIAADVDLLKKSRVDGLEAELERLRTSPPAPMTTAEALRTPPEPRTSARTAPGLNAALSARAALGAVRGQAPATSPAVWKSTSELGYPEKYCVDLRESPRHRADAATGTTSRRWRGIATPSHRRSYGSTSRRWRGTPEIYFPHRSPALRRAATTYDADEVEELGGEAFFFEGGGGGKNDEFLDDEMEELLAIGGDPTFLEQARPEFEGWDGVEDDAAHFDDPAD